MQRTIKIISLLSLLALSACTGIITVEETKASQPNPLKADSSMPPVELSTCLLPYVDKAEFFLNKTRLNTLARQYEDKYQIYGMYMDIAMYVVEMEPDFQGGSIAKLYNRPNLYGRQGLAKTFKTGMAECQ